MSMEGAGQKEYIDGYRSESESKAKERGSDKQHWVIILS